MLGNTPRKALLLFLFLFAGLFMLQGCDEILDPITECTLTIQTEGDGIVEPDSGAKYDSGSMATLKVFPEEGWEFDRWAGEHGH